MKNEVFSFEFLTSQYVVEGRLYIGTIQSRRFNERQTVALGKGSGFVSWHRTQMPQVRLVSHLQNLTAVCILEANNQQDDVKGSGCKVTHLLSVHQPIPSKTPYFQLKQPIQYGLKSK